MGQHLQVPDVTRQQTFQTLRVAFTGELQKMGRVLLIGCGHLNQPASFPGRPVRNVSLCRQRILAIFFQTASAIPRITPDHACNRHTRIALPSHDCPRFIRKTASGRHTNSRRLTASPFPNRTPPPNSETPNEGNFACKTSLRDGSMATSSRYEVKTQEDRHRHTS